MEHLTIEELRKQYLDQLGAVIKRREEIEKQMRIHIIDPELEKRYKVIRDEERGLKKAILEMSSSCKGNVKLE